MDEYKTVRLLIIDDFMTTPIETRNAIGGCGRFLGD